MGQFEGFIGVDFWTALFVLLNTLAIFFVARKFLFNPVHKMITDRQKEIDTMYADAGKAKEEAERANTAKSRFLAKHTESDNKQGDIKQPNPYSRADRRYCGKHYSESEKHTALKGEQSKVQKRHLKESGNAERNHLSAPLYKPFRISFRNTEHIQTAYRNLSQKYSAAFNVGKEYLYNAIPERYDEKQV